MNPWLITGTLLLVIGAGAVGFVKGGQLNEAKHVAAWAVAQQEATEAGIALAAAETERLALVEANRMISRELEDQAYAEPVSNTTCLSPSRGLRLDQRIKAANRAAAGQP
jgi:ketopantoate reductase